MLQRIEAYDFMRPVLNRPKTEVLAQCRYSSSLSVPTARQSVLKGVFLGV